MPTKRNIDSLAVGFGITSVVLTITFLLASGFEVELTPAEGRFNSLLLIGTLSLSTAVFEELIFRYWLTSYLMKRLKGVVLTILISSAVFALLHMGNNHITFFAICSHLLGGIVYATAFVLSKSIWLPIGLHFGWNVTQYLFSLPMSGSLKEGLSGWGCPIIVYYMVARMESRQAGQVFYAEF